MKIIKNLIILCTFCLLTSCAMQDSSDSIVGGWRINANVLNNEVQVSDTNYVELYFYEDTTGTERIIANDSSVSERPFSYTVVDDMVTMEFENESLREFSYYVEDDNLIIIDRNIEITYERLEG